MTKATGALAAMIALIAGILGAVDPVTCVTRAAIAFVAGWAAASLWRGLLMAHSQRGYTMGSVAPSGKANTEE